MTRLLILSVALAVSASASPAPAVDIGSRRELFVDNALIEHLSGRAEFRLHEPADRGVVLKHDLAWKGPSCGYHSIFKDGPIYRMYYKTWQRTVGPGAPDTRRSSRTRIPRPLHTPAPRRSSGRPTPAGCSSSSPPTGSTGHRSRAPRS